MLRRHWIEFAWAGFAAINVVVILMLGAWETIPFHFIWVSLTLLYGIRTWKPGTTAMILTAVCAGTGVSLLYAVTHQPLGPDLAEMTEVPLMAAMFLAMVWHAQRRKIALTQMKGFAEDSRRLLESQREFVRDASHTLRTPITVARGHAELIRDNTEDDQTRRDAEVVLDELARLARLSERLLLLAASEHPGFLSLRPIEIRAFLLGIARRWSATTQREWLVDISVDGILIADDERLATAIDALVENSIKFTSSMDGIALRAYPDGSVLVVEVTDTGLGIGPEELGRVFEPFMRSRAQRNVPANGTGLGLAIVKAIVQSHGGTVDVESSSVKGTTTFRLHLPKLLPSVELSPVGQPSVLGA
jgi:signal transduction histidine kinase